MKILGITFIITSLLIPSLSFCQNLEKQGISEIKLAPDDYLLIDVQYLLCKQTSDCALVEEVCGRGWRTLNKQYQKQAEQVVSNRNNVIDCGSFSYQKPPIACLDGICTKLPDKEKCMLKKTSGECLSTCNIIAENGRCQHICQKGQACD